jgi:transcriptional regulator with PAS, ATPase and Fis domain
MQPYAAESVLGKVFERPSAEISRTEYPAYDDSKPILLQNKGQSSYHESEDVEEILSIEEMEKDMIRKALKKFNNRRKDAADELGISERTLYRKIKEYNIPD